MSTHKHSGTRQPRVPRKSDPPVAFRTNLKL